MSIAAIVLAAGASTRMGQPKQVLPWGDRTLLEHTISVAISVCDRVIVVVGANANRLDQMDAPFLQWVKNPNWQTGMGSSLKQGMMGLQSELVDAVILLVCDQPFISPSLLKQMVDIYHERQAEIVASAYSNTIGVPVLFDRSHFSTLLTLPSDSGAKLLLKRYRDRVQTVEFPEGAIDLDTLEEYHMVYSRYHE